MAHKKINAQHPKYQELWAALKNNLVERDHEEEAWAALGEKQYFYSHTEHQRVESQTRTGTSVQGKSAGKGCLSLLQGILILDCNFDQSLNRKPQLLSHKP